LKTHAAGRTPDVTNFSYERKKCITIDFLYKLSRELSRPIIFIASSGKGELMYQVEKKTKNVIEEKIIKEFC
jgi:hypothetical protein